ncbi:MAG: winged helix-turn-helix transcriptional regulator [Candidatus Aenigmarchaeota archaeon]|nr:winged helix-turn-helix transcriptional regulator [Candidatus Aenigmarchaeota archaeon]
MNGSLELEVRRRIFNCINESPGLHFREIQRRTGLATGSIDYHIHFLHKNGLIRVERDKNYARYYPLTKNWSEEEKEILALLRNTKIRHILIFILEKKKSTPLKIAESTGISLSTLSWYLKQLKEKNIISERKKGRFRFYRVNEPDMIVKYLVAHKSSFLDVAVDRFIETWEF